MTSDIAGQLETIRRFVSEDSETYKTGKGAEANVLEHLVRPLLYSLGWDSSPYNVAKEYGVKLEDRGGQVDFALRKGTKILTAIEGKKLGGRIGPDSDAAVQLRNYLISKDLKFGVTSDGDSWYLYRRQGFELEVVWSVNVSNDSAEQCAGRLANISPENVEHLEERIERDKKAESVMRDKWQSIVKNRESQIGALALLLKSTAELSDKDLGIDVKEAEKFLEKLYPEQTSLLLVPQVESGITGNAPIRKIARARGSVREAPPKRVRIKNESFDVGKVYAILTCTAEWLIKQGHITRDECPVMVTHGPKRYLINTVPNHIDGARFQHIRKLSNGLYMEVAYNRSRAEIVARDLLEKYGYSKDLLSVEY